MSKRYYKPQTQSQVLSQGTGVLPTSQPIGVYYRQSTDAQIGNISTSIQTIDMVAYLQGRGWTKENIYLIDMDAGVSGTTKIDEREGMRHLFDLITQGKIGAVACQDEDRLFRDVTQIQVNIFIEACRNANVLVITPNMVYDFANELTGSFHARQFRFKSEMAAEYIDTVIRGKLHRAKTRLLMEGKWAGFIVLPGYMVDVRKTLADGSENPNWRRYVPFSEYAAVVNEYFRLFISHAGNVHATVEHIHAHGPYYPDPSMCLPPTGYKFVTRMKRYGHGHCPARNGLVNLLTNATLLGHWAVNGIVVRWNNHPAIVDEHLFWQAFNYLSPVTLDGKENLHFRPFTQNARPSLEAERSVERPLCAGMLVSQYEGNWKKIGICWIKQREYYDYVLAAPHPKEDIIWRRASGYIDDAVKELVRNKLKSTFADEIWENTLAEATRNYEDEKRRIRVQISTLERVMENQVLSLETLTNQDLIRTVEQRYEDAQLEHKRLSDDLTSTITQSQRVEALQKLKNMYDPTLETWDVLSTDEMRVIFHTFIQHIEAKPIDGHGLEVKVHWIDGSSDQVVLAKQMRNGWKTWLESETTELMNLVDINVTQLEIAAAFPTRTWKQIADKIAKCYGYGKVYFSPKPIREYETYLDYKLHEEANNSQPYQATSGDPWTPSDETQLMELLRQKATKLQLLEAFPFRRWMSVVKKLRTLCGKDVVLPEDKSIHWQDTLATYKARMGETIHQYTEQLSVISESHPQSTPNPADGRCTVPPS